LAAWLFSRPRFEINESHLVAGKDAIAWVDIRRVDQTAWVSPLVVYLTLVQGVRVRVFYPGHTRQCRLLLRLIQQRCSRALINGVPHSRIFGEPPRPEPTVVAPPRPRFLSDQDESDVERMFQILKSAGRFGGDEK